jgi:hypothetical protein
MFADFGDVALGLDHANGSETRQRGPAVIQHLNRQVLELIVPANDKHQIIIARCNADATVAWECRVLDFGREAADAGPECSSVHADAHVVHPANVLRGTKRDEERSDWAQK